MFSCLSCELNQPDLFLNCVDSRLDAYGGWYSRLHIGPFWTGSRLQIGTRLRRSLLTDLEQTSIIAVKLEGGLHEFFCFPGINESISSILYQFRKVRLHAPFLAREKTLLLSFLFLGPGIFFSKDIFFPNGIQCINPEIPLMTLSPGIMLRGYVLIRKSRVLSSTYKSSKAPRLGETWSFRTEKFSGKILQWAIPIVKKFQKSSTSTWLRIGCPSNIVERVGFYIESLGILNHENEVLIFEILTNGRISPRQAVREAALILVHKFLNIAQRTIPLYKTFRYHSVTKKTFDKKPSFLQNNRLRISTHSLISEHTFYTLYHTDFSRFREPLGLNLGNLDMTKERYHELQSLGFKTLGQLLERFAFESTRFSPFVKKQIQLVLFRLGFFPFY